MTDTPLNPAPPDSGKLRKFFPLTPELGRELRAIESMPAGAWRLWSYLATVEPYGNDYLELPDLVDILTECNISKATFYRAIALFHEHELFDLQPTRMYVLNLRGQKIVSKMRQLSQNCDSESQKQDSQSQNCNSKSHSCETEKNKPAQGEGLGDRECTNNRTKDLKNNRTVPPIPPCSEDIDREGIGTDALDPLTQDVEALSAKIQAAGVRPNKTIQATIATLLLNESSAAATKLVENAISALEEQQKKGTVRNPGGFFIAALRRSFTANAAKVEARQRRQEPPSFNQVSCVVNEALARGDRQFALARLQQLWSAGHQDLVEELCVTWKRDWGFSITTQGVRDAES